MPWFLPPSVPVGRLDLQEQSSEINDTEPLLKDVRNTSQSGSILTFKQPWRVNFKNYDRNRNKRYLLPPTSAPSLAQLLSQIRGDMADKFKSPKDLEDFMAAIELIAQGSAESTGADVQALLRNQKFKENNLGNLGGTIGLNISRYQASRQPQVLQDLYFPTCLTLYLKQFATASAAPALVPAAHR
ncbi:hypothetical protein FB45DRAFT_859272 [Roridomyces roridus]|uniref:Uncharacterized protein n=1 Tax=Roridomyces roridus TaxID=1738132 RepID=A0AAD7CJH1_9AGAR|nr:hypothetical protein FB45DRAFT_859272 [Roridomyces roridus]